MTRVLALVILSALLCACTATFTPDSSRASWTQDAPDSWMGNFYSGSGHNFSKRWQSFWRRSQAIYRIIYFNASRWSVRSTCIQPAGRFCSYHDCNSWCNNYYCPCGWLNSCCCQQPVWCEAYHRRQQGCS